MNEDYTTPKEEAEAIMLTEAIEEAKRLAAIVAQLNAALDIAIEARDDKNA